MKKLLILTSSIFMCLFMQASAQTLGYTSSSTTPLGHATFGLTTYSGNQYGMYLYLPAAALGHVSYASIRTEGVNGGDVSQHSETDNSAATFGFGAYTSTPIYIYWDIDYDDGTWESVAVEIHYGDYVGFEITQQ